MASGPPGPSHTHAPPSTTRRARLRVRRRARWRARLRTRPRKGTTSGGSGSRRSETRLRPWRTTILSPPGGKRLPQRPGDMAGAVPARGRKGRRRGVPVSLQSVGWSAGAASGAAAIAGGLRGFGETALWACRNQVLPNAAWAAHRLRYEEGEETHTHLVPSCVHVCACVCTPQGSMCVCVCVCV
jgi:hypothetical protein